MYEEKNTANNMPAQCEIYAEGDDAYKFMFMAKGGGSANKSFLFQATPSVLTKDRLLAFLKEKVLTLGTAACPPYHLAIVIGGTSAELCMKTVKLASARYLDALPTHGSPDGNAFRDLEMEQEILKMTQSLGVGAQFGGKYFCHDVRVIRMPRHGASLPIGLGVSCSADRQVLGKITRDGVYLEELEHNPAQYLPAVEQSLGGEVVKIDLNQPMKDILATLASHPIKTRVSMTGTMIVARDSAHAKLRERLEKGEPLPDYFKNHPVYYAGPAKTPGWLCLRRVRSYHRGTDGLVRRSVPGGGRIDGDGGQGQPRGRGARGLQEARRLLSRLDRRGRGKPRRALHQEGRGAGISRTRHGSDLAHRGRGFPGLHHHRRQGQRLFQGIEPGVRALGLDGFRNGWVAVTLDGDRREISFLRDIANVLSGRFDRLAIDIPIGMDDSGERGCDLLARDRLRPHTSRVFTGARRWLWEEFGDPDKANIEALRRGQKRVSRQLWHLGPKIMQVDAFVRENRGLDILEVHPELVFQRLNGGEALPSKKSDAGAAQRRKLLIWEGFEEIDHWLNCVRMGTGAKADDVLDACAVAISARHPKGSVPEGTPQKDAHGIAMQIWF